MRLGGLNLPIETFGTRGQGLGVSMPPTIDYQGEASDTRRFAETVY